MVLNLQEIDAVLRQFEGEYFFDYAGFVGSLREYVVRALEAQYAREPGDLHRRAFMLNLYREEYTAYEDLGAFINAFLSHREDASLLPLTYLLKYRPGSVKLDIVLGERQLTNGDALMERLGILEWVSERLTRTHPEINFDKVLRRACYYITEDCYRSQKQEGVSAFNKIKHALLLIADGRRLISGHPPGPAVLFASDPSNPASAQNPVSVMTITMADRNFEERLRQVHFIQKTLRLFALLYIAARYPEVVRRRGIGDPAEALNHRPFFDLRDFAREMTSTEWDR